MEDLEKTTIYPDQNPNAVLSKKILKLVILVNNENLVVTADRIARDMPSDIDRQVIWYKNLNDIDLINKFPGLPDDLTGIMAFSLSTRNKVSDLIKNWQDGDYERIELAFNNAGLDENN
jgi:hypothetical protein